MHTSLNPKKNLNSKNQFGTGQDQHSLPKMQMNGAKVAIQRQPFNTNVMFPAVLDIISPVFIVLFQMLYISVIGNYRLLRSIKYTNVGFNGNYNRALHFNALYIKISQCSRELENPPHLSLPNKAFKSEKGLHATKKKKNLLQFRCGKNMYKEY